MIKPWLLKIQHGKPCHTSAKLDVKCICECNQSGRRAVFDQLSVRVFLQRKRDFKVQMKCFSFIAEFERAAKSGRSSSTVSSSTVSISSSSRVTKV